MSLRFRTGHGTLAPLWTSESCLDGQGFEVYSAMAKAEAQLDIFGGTASNGPSLDVGSLVMWRFSTMVAKVHSRLVSVVLKLWAKICAKLD